MHRRRRSCAGASSCAALVRTGFACATVTTVGSAATGATKLGTPAIGEGTNGDSAGDSAAAIAAEVSVGAMSGTIGAMIGRTLRGAPRPPSAAWRQSTRDSRSRSGRAVRVREWGERWRRRRSLASAFALAGAPSLVGSLWEGGDDSTAELMSGFYRALDQNGGDRLEVLRTARLNLLRTKKTVALVELSVVRGLPCRRSTVTACREHEGPAHGRVPSEPAS